MLAEATLALAAGTTATLATKEMAVAIANMSLVKRLGWCMET
jgi:hypothetical protein